MTLCIGVYVSVWLILYTRPHSSRFDAVYFQSSSTIPRQTIYLHDAASRGGEGDEKDKNLFRIPSKED